MTKTFTMDADLSSCATQDNVHFSADCSAHDLNLWDAFAELSKRRSKNDVPMLSSTEYTVPADSRICHPMAWSDVVPVICKGWAMSSVLLPDGRQQIIAFLLPGEIASTALVFGPTAGRMVQSITKVKFRTFKRSELNMALSKNPELFKKFIAVLTDERAEADQLAIDLGRRAADERLARLILRLTKRLAKRGMMHGQTVEFPVRQHQIADATGLTPVHVSRVLGTFREMGLIEINGRSLTIRDADGLYRIATLKSRQQQLRTPSNPDPL